VAMREVTDSFLLTIAQVSATPIGLFLVGVFFHVGTGLRRRDRQARDAFEAYLRAGTRIVLLLFGLPPGFVGPKSDPRCCRVRRHGVRG
jgi:hypothetical protein